MDLEWHVIARLLVAAGLGAAMGLEREAADQPAGLRTNLTVAVGAALFGVISTTGFSEFQTTQRATNIQFDVTRVASLVVSGIGFIGAGMIFRRGSAVHNLTTAASLWVVAAVGLSCGVGDFGPTVVTTVIVLFALVVLRLPRQWVRHTLSPDHATVRIVLRPGTDDGGVMAAFHALDGIRIHGAALEKSDGRYVISADFRADRTIDLRARISPLARRDDIDTFEVDNG